MSKLIFCRCISDFVCWLPIWIRVFSFRSNLWFRGARRGRNWENSHQSLLSLHQVCHWITFELIYLSLIILVGLLLLCILVSYTTGSWNFLKLDAILADFLLRVCFFYFFLVIGDLCFSDSWFWQYKFEEYAVWEFKQRCPSYLPLIELYRPEIQWFPSRNLCKKSKHMYIFFIHSSCLEIMLCPSYWSMVILIIPRNGVLCVLFFFSALLSSVIY